MPIRSCIILLVCLIFVLNLAQAESIHTTVFNVFESQKTERILILSGADGRIYKTFKNEENLRRMKSYIGKVVRLEFSTNGKEAILTNIQLANPNEIDIKTMDLNHFRFNELRQFAPTDLQSVEEANDIFKNMLNDGDKRFSECFKRAHMWAYDMWSTLGIRSEKIFIFFTKRYAILEEFEWWFHVAPLVSVAGEDYVLDGTFMSKPVPLKEWKDYFIKSSEITCPMIDRYQEFEEHQWSRLCYLMKVPMYFLSPLNIQNRDKRGVDRNHWVLEELQDARKSFKKWDEVYEGLDTGKRVRKF